MRHYIGDFREFTMPGPMLISCNRRIIRNGRAVDITGCFWCGNHETAICAVCVAKADRQAAKTAGQIAYETDCERAPRYHDGTPRLSWERLPDYARQSWERNPTPREYPLPTADLPTPGYD
jgi:hypothetical protein